MSKPFPLTNAVAVQASEVKQKLKLVYLLRLAKWGLFTRYRRYE